MAYPWYSGFRTSGPNMLAEVTYDMNRVTHKRRIRVEIVTANVVGFSRKAFSGYTNADVEAKLRKYFRTLAEEPARELIQDLECLIYYGRQTA